VSDIHQTHQLENLRVKQLTDKLDREHRDRVQYICTRGLYNSTPRLFAISKAQAHRIQELIDGRIAFRKESARLYPCLAAGEPLDHLLYTLWQEVASFGEPYPAILWDKR